MMAKHAHSDGGSQDTARISKSELDAVLKRTRSGVRPAVRPVFAKTTAHEQVTPPSRDDVADPPKSFHRLASSRFTADEQPTRPAGTRRAAIEVVAHDEGVSDRLADEMFRAVVSARSSTTLAVVPAAPEIAPTSAVVPVPRTAAFTAGGSHDGHDDDGADELVRELDAVDELTRERTRALAIFVNLALLSAVLATLAWYANRAFVPLLH